jgi:hypothetical protein
VLWTHNDSGDRPRVLAVDRAGALLADVAIAGAEAVDWEDIAIGPAAPGGAGDALYIADTGDNDGVRPEVVVYRVREPDPAAGGPGTSAPAQRLALRYPDGAHDAEALLVDPAGGALVVVTKSFGGESGVYVATRPSASAVTLLRLRARLSLGPGSGRGRRSPPATSRPTVAQSRCAPTAARSSGSGGPESRSRRRCGGARAARERTCSARDRARRSRSPRGAAPSTPCPKERARRSAATPRPGAPALAEWGLASRGPGNEKEQKPSRDSGAGPYPPPLRSPALGLRARRHPRRARFV